MTDFEYVPEAEVARPRFGASKVWVESPLQLLSAVETHAAGLLGTETMIVPRKNMPLAATTRALLAAAPAGLSINDPARRPPTPIRTDDRWVTGDAYSGRVQRTLLGPVQAKEVVIIDDGMATLALIRQLISTEPTPIVRGRTNNSASRKALGLALWYRLRFMARDQRLLIVSALDVGQETRERMHEVGIKFARHRFEWLAAQPVEEKFPEPTLVIGSAMSADGLIHTEPYLGWLAELAADGPFAYFPHRRENPETLKLIATLPGVHMKEHTIPIEMRLRALKPGQQIRSLPSTVIPSLRLLLGTERNRIFPKPVPGSWWTGTTPPEVREHLSSSLKV
ncbi:hypothetical protein OK351_16625 [Glutamicibacter sp. MNS18]|uniref:hypothetical protein n=1 Tax=Glutamicibacter sp. MNS18 TaxID=2989817 RepID=UPI002235A952|nr:hypothetical protein [Glutamicibacter sp. MNS18]MCW4467110.1 hypothetical protein [Glutamicibacter sp. MNS18]